MSDHSRRPSLDQLARRAGTDKSSHLNAFTEKYEPLLEPRRDLPLVMVEIGVLQGQSLRLWHEYFPAARIYGLDLQVEGVDLRDLAPRVSLHRLDQGDPTDLAAFATRLATEHGGIDLVIDDGSHLSAHQILTFKSFFPVLRPGGLYCVEDVTTSYGGAPYDGGVGRPDTFLRFAQDLISFIPMSMGGVPPREPWEQDLDSVSVCGFGGLVAVGKLSPERKARLTPYLTR